MTDDIKLLSLETLRAADELFDQTLDKVLEDILDPNKKATAPRKVTLTLNIKPTEDRRMAATSISVAATLGPRTPYDSIIFIDRKDGKAIAAERDPNQRRLFNDEQEVDTKPADNVHPINLNQET